MEELALHVLDIAQNSILAEATRIVIRVEEDPEGDRLTIEVSDDGVGMDDAAVRSASDPFTTSRPGKRVGLGLPMLREAARAAGGDLKVTSRAGGGTTVSVSFGYGHIDRQPLGSMPDTILTLIAGHPEVSLRYEHIRSGREFVLDTVELEEELGKGSLTSPAVLRGIREAMERAF